MPLPEFTESGDLPVGLHSALIGEVIVRFGIGGKQRTDVTARLRRIWELAIATGRLERIILFGSYVTDALDPNDLDVILVMHDDFRPEECTAEQLDLFDHRRADARLGASIFWIRPGMLLGEPIDAFLSHWQVKRDGSHRGIIEVRP